MKKYTRKGLIRFFEKLPPRSRPCKPDVCPIAVFMGPGFIESYPAPGDASMGAIGFDNCLADFIDEAAGLRGWGSLTAAQIVKIAKAAPHV